MSQQVLRRQQISRLSAELSQHYKNIDSSPPQDNCLLGVPPLIPGEAFSSWCWRIQSYLKVPAGTILSLFGLSGPSFWVDTAGVEFDIESIAKTVMQPVQSLETLMWPKGSLLGKPEFACLTSVPFRRRPNYRYCETCLRNDPIPYVRLLWRLACAYVCPIHGSILRDLCPFCQKPVVLPPLKQHKSDNASFRVCHHCGGDLCNVKTGFFPRELQYLVLGRQAELLRFIAVESRLFEVLSCSDGNHENAITTKIDNTIDLTSERSAFLLFQQLLSSLYGSPATDANECSNELKHYLLSASIPIPGQENCILNLGFEGGLIFGDDAPNIAGYLNSRQDLWGGTYWWSIDRRDFLSMKPVFTDKDSRLALSWVERLKKHSTNQNG